MIQRRIGFLMESIIMYKVVISGKEHQIEDITSLKTYLEGVMHALHSHTPEKRKAMVKVYTFTSQHGWVKLTPRKRP